jgi:hypothetical protein
LQRYLHKCGSFSTTFTKSAGSFSRTVKQQGAHRPAKGELIAFRRLMLPSMLPGKA